MSRSSSLVLLVLAGLAAPAATYAADDADTVVVRRGGAEVTLGEVDARMAEIPADKRAGFIDSPERIDQMLQQLLLLEQLAAEARAEHLDRDPEFLAALDLGEKRLLAQLRLQRIAEQGPKIDAEALAHERYLAAPKMFALPETLSVRHILLKPASPADAPARRAEAEKLRQRILAGEAIGDLARQYSEDRSTRDLGGLLAGVLRGKTVKAFEDAAFALQKPGDVSPVVETEFGFHVIELVERTPGRARSFDEVKAQLVAEVENSERAKLPNQHMAELNNMKLDADPEVVASLRTRYGMVQDSAAAVPPADGSAER